MKKGGNLCFYEVAKWLARIKKARNTFLNRIWIKKKQFVVLAQYAGARIRRVRLRVFLRIGCVDMPITRIV
eukprot:scaffold1335_cov282-Chaetoceros_neogracile.AAC.20